MNLFIVPVHLHKNRLPMLDVLKDRLAERTKLPIRVKQLDTARSLGYNDQRHQYQSGTLLHHLAEQANGDVYLGVSDEDLFIPIFTFVLGEAQLEGNAAVVSIHRLRNSYYGMPEDWELCSERLFKVALHEFAHLLGLMHCGDSRCLMHASSHVDEVDLRGDEFCSDCQSLVWNKLDQIHAKREQA